MLQYGIYVFFSLQHCFCESSGSDFESLPPNQTKSDQAQYANVYWPSFTTPDYSNYSYPMMQPQWHLDEKLNAQQISQWNQSQQTLPLSHSAAIPPTTPSQSTTPLPDSDLELFAEHFKQRRMKLGVTQADVGKALGAMMIPGVESLSQSTICRFESLTLSRTNMIALRPLLQIWLDRAEAFKADSVEDEGTQTQEATFFPTHNVGGLPQGRRKRTCITDSERKALEAYFSVQPQPSSERVAQIASLLGLPKSVVRVWFCNQRQKQKRLKCGLDNPRSKCSANVKTNITYSSR